VAVTPIGRIMAIYMPSDSWAPSEQPVGAGDMQSLESAIQSCSLGGGVSVAQDASLEEANLFVGDLAKEVTEKDLRDAFSEHGHVLGVDIKRDRATRSSLGYGFVQYATRADACVGKRMMQKRRLGSRAIRVGWAQKNTNLFVGDLDSSVTNEILRAAFGKFGALVLEDTFMKGDNYGFVRFRNRQDAEQAKQTMEGHVLGKRPIRIGWGEASTQRNCVHVQFDAQLAEAYLLAEADLESAFSCCGEIESVTLPRTLDRQHLRGYGFVHFADHDGGEETAEVAIARLHNTEIVVARKGADGEPTTSAGPSPMLRIECHFGRRLPRKNLPEPGLMGSGGMPHMQLGGPMRAGWNRDVGSGGHASGWTTGPGGHAGWPGGHPNPGHGGWGGGGGGPHMGNPGMGGMQHGGHPGMHGQGGMHPGMHSPHSHELMMLQVQAQQLMQFQNSLRARARSQGMWPPHPGQGPPPGMPPGPPMHGQMDEAHLAQMAQMAPQHPHGGPGGQGAPLPGGMEGMSHPGQYGGAPMHPGHQGGPAEYEGGHHGGGFAMGGPPGNGAGASYPSGYPGGYGGQ